MDRKSETKMAQTQRNFQSDRILRNKFSNEPIKKSFKKNSNLLDETNEQCIPNSKENVDVTPQKLETSNITPNIENHPQLTNEKKKKTNKKDEKIQEEEDLIDNKTNKNNKIEPVLKKNIAAKNIPPKNKINNSNKEQNNDFSIIPTNRTDEYDIQQLNNNESNLKLQEISPLRFNSNNNALDFNKNTSKFEECTGDMDFSQRDLKDHLKMITIKTFIVYIFYS